jgi:hypothetical protein
LDATVADDEGDAAETVGGDVGDGELDTDEVDVGHCETVAVLVPDVVVDID